MSSFLTTPAAQLRTDTYAVNGPRRGPVLPVYVLQAGETLTQVAAKFGITPQALLAANPRLKQIAATRSGLHAGLRLNIPRSIASSSTQPNPGYALSTASPAPTGLASPTGGVSTRTPYTLPERSFFSDLSSAAPPPTPITWPDDPRLCRPAKNARCRPLPPLRLGVVTPDVETLQRGLARLGYAVRVDGDFGAGTDAAVRNFQSGMGLSPTGTMDGPTWMALKRTADAVRAPSQILVTARREQFFTEDERNAYDILVALAYDYPGQVATRDADGYGLREILRLCGQPMTNPTNITPQAVTALASRAMQFGMPLNDTSLAPLRVLQQQGYNRTTYHGAKALGDFFVRVFPGYSSVNNHTYDALIVSTARQYGVPPELVKAVMSAESSFHPGAVSSAKARGLMQVMPDTAAFVGVPNTSTPEANVLAGVRYLAYLLRGFNGDLVNTLAAYNAGPRRVENNGGVPPIQETMDYVRKVLVNYAYYLQHPPY